MRATNPSTPTVDWPKTSLHPSGVGRADNNAMHETAKRVADAAESLDNFLVTRPSRSAATAVTFRGRSWSAGQLAGRRRGRPRARISVYPIRWALSEFRPWKPAAHASRCVVGRRRKLTARPRLRTLLNPTGSDGQGSCEVKKTKTEHGTDSQSNSPERLERHASAAA